MITGETMEWDIPAWVAQTLILAILAFGVTAMAFLRSISKKLSLNSKTNEKLLAMHLEPDEHGFGTGGQNGRLDKIVVAIKDQTYYLKIMAESMRGGETVLPPIHDPDG